MRDAMSNPIVDEVSETKRDLYTFSTEFECWETLWEDGKYTYRIVFSPREAPDSFHREVKDDGTEYEDRLDDDALQEVILDWIEARG